MGSGEQRMRLGWIGIGRMGGALATRLVDEVIAAGPEKVGAAFFDKNKTWKEKGAVPLELGASLAVYLASTESDGITGKLIKWACTSQAGRVEFQSTARSTAGQ